MGGRVVRGMFRGLDATGPHDALFLDQDSRVMRMNRIESDPKAVTRLHRTERRRVDTRLPGKGNPNSHGARPVYHNHLDG